MAAPRVRRPALAIGGLAFVGAGVAIAFGVFDESSVTHRETMAGIERIELDTGAGEVTIRRGDVQRTTVTETKTYRWGDEDPAFERRGAELVLASCDGWCSTSHEVVVPRGVAVSGGIGSGELNVTGAESVDVEAGSGTARVSDIARDVRVSVGSGEAELVRIGGSVAAEAGSGMITGRKLTGPVEAEAGSGELVLELASPASVTASTGSGDIELTVPSGPYRIEGDTGSGDRDIGVATSSTARHALSLDSGSGNVTIARR